MSAKNRISEIDPILVALPQPVTVKAAAKALGDAGLPRTDAGIRRRLKMLNITVQRGSPKEPVLTRLLQSMPHPIDVPATVVMLREQGHSYTYPGVYTICRRLGIPTVQADAPSTDRRRLTAVVARLEERVARLEKLLESKTQ